MQLAILERRGLIRIMGDFLALNKSTWYLVDYKWIQVKWKCTNLVQDKVLEATYKADEIVSLQ